MTSDAGEAWPTWDLITEWLGEPGVDFELRPGETSELPLEDVASLTAARRFRDVLGRFASGVTVVTGLSEGRPVGLTCQSFTSVSLEPPLVLFVAARTSRAWPLIQRSGHFCVNFLASAQTQVSNVMASRGADKFATLSWAPAPASGSPVLDDILGYVDCTIHAVHEAGDHHIVVGRVLDLAGTELTEPLLYFRGRYTTTAD